MNGNKRYRCRNCGKTRVEQYHYKAYRKEIISGIISLHKEGCGIRSIARLLKIAVQTVLNRILKIARATKKPPIVLGKTYEVDEVCVYVKRKSNLQWIAYAIRKDTKEVVDFTIGSRTKNTLKRVTDTLILSKAKRIYTDKLKQ